MSVCIYAVREAGRTMHALIKPWIVYRPPCFGVRTEPSLSPTNTYTHSYIKETVRSKSRDEGRVKKKGVGMVRDKRKMKGENIDGEETAPVNIKSLFHSDLQRPFSILELKQHEACRVSGKWTLILPLPQPHGGGQLVFIYSKHTLSVRVGQEGSRGPYKLVYLVKRQDLGRHGSSWKDLQNFGMHLSV